MKVSVKATFGVLIMFILFFMSSVIVNADVIFTPDDNFYKDHYSDCTDVDRNYIADGPEGRVTIWEKPNSRSKVAEYENGIAFTIWCTYTDKKSVVWGLYDSTLAGARDDDKIIGWLRMEDLDLIYDNISFCEEHINEFRKYYGELNDYTTDLPIILWDYPGSAQSYESFHRIDAFGEFQYIYTDADDLEWAFLHYEGGHLVGQWDGVWIYMSDPTKKNLQASDKAQPTIIPAADVQPLTIAEKSSKVLPTLGIAIVILVAVTAILIEIFWKKDKRNKEG